MKGYFYKEWKQNQMWLLCIVLMSVGLVFLPILTVMIAERTISREAFLYFAKDGLIFWELLTTVGWVGVMALQEWSFLREDDMRAWGFFVASNPKGIRGCIYAKYVYVAFTSICFWVLATGFDYLFIRILNTISGAGFTQRTEYFWMLFLGMLFMNALEMPFVIRYGVKKGTNVKLIVLLVVLIILIVIFLGNPMGIIDAIFTFFVDKEIPISLKWGLPIVSIASYILSCLLSCKLYMKGVFECYW